MKKYVVAFFVAILAAWLFSFISYPYNLKIFVRTNAPENTLISLEYKTVNGTFKKSVKTDFNHQAFFKIFEEKILSFRAIADNNITISSIYIHGSDEYNILTSNSVWSEKVITASKKIDFYNILFIFALFFYIVIYWKKYVSSSVLKKEDFLNRNHNIDFLRILFTLLIILYHIDNRLNIWSNLGSAVEFFFILSGYFLAVASAKTENTLLFIKKKIIRFMPLILFSEMLSILAVENVSLSSFFAEVLLLPRTGLYPTVGYNGATWYINVLFWVSLAYFYILKTQNKKTAHLIIGLMTFFAAVICVYKNFALNDSDKSLLNILFPISMMKGVCSMGVGYFLAVLLSETKEKILWSFLEVSVFSYALVMMFFKSCVPGNNIFYVIIFMLLLYLFLRRQGLFSRLLNQPVFSKYSKYCLSFYVTHYPIVTFWLFPIRDKDPEWFFSHKIIVASVSCIVILIIGIFSYHFIEKPVGRFLKKILINNNDMHSDPRNHFV